MRAWFVLGMSLLLLLPMIPAVSALGGASVSMSSRNDCSRVTGLCPDPNIYQVWANVTSSDPKDTVILVEYALYDSSNVTITTNTGVRDLNVTFSPVQSRHICDGMTIYTEDSDGNWRSTSPLILCPSTDAVVSPYQSNFGTLPRVNMTIGSNEDYVTSFTAVALVLNSTGHPMYEATGTVTCAPFGNCSPEIVFLVLPHGVYPVEIYALNKAGVVVTFKFTLNVIV